MNQTTEKSAAFYNMSTLEASAEFDRLCAERRRIENRYSVSNHRASDQERIKQLEAKKSALVKQAGDLRKRLDSNLAKIRLAQATARACKKTLFAQYRELQASNPAAARDFWNANESAIVSGK